MDSERIGLLRTLERPVLVVMPDFRGLRSEKILVPDINSSLKEEFFLGFFLHFLNKCYPFLMLVLGIESWPRWLKPSKNSITGMTSKQRSTYEKCHKHNGKICTMGRSSCIMTVFWNDGHE